MRVKTDAHILLDYMESWGILFADEIQERSDNKGKRREMVELRKQARDCFAIVAKAWWGFGDKMGRTVG